MASSSSSHNWEYDVFPSFSGEDVRQTFLSHFIKELDRKLISVFKDNEMKRSNSLDPELKKAIKTSKIAVVVLSKNYSSSSWCLNELLEIMKCEKELGQVIIPIFYNLDPSHVRKLSGDFGEAFEKTCQTKTEDERQLWRRALTDVANILGFHSLKWCNEAEMIEIIANDVLGKLNLTPSKDFDNFVGIEEHVAKMSELLHLESKEVRMVGIWGSSGIGKTTIARVLYSRLSRRFQRSVFIDKAFIYKSMEIYNSANPDDYNMKLALQRILLSKILNKKDIMIDHLGAVEERLKHHKVLIFIDNLEDQVVLDAVAGQTNWFGCGSRIIVITKDKHVLRAHGIDYIYEVCLPSEELALEILCQSTFKRKSPPDGFMEVASEVALLAGNLPLGLTVLGSYLRGRDKEDWMDMLPRFRNCLDGKIEKTLRLSYDGLSNEKDKAIFRHIACLFNGRQVNDIKLLLADSDLDVRIGLKNLVDKSLIYERHTCVVMHSLVTKMGKEIVRTQSNEPGEREFLVEKNDIFEALEYNTGTKKVLGITLDMDETDHELHIHESAFKDMRNLLFLEIFTKQKKGIRWDISQGFNYFPPKLRLLRLDGYPMRYMPSNFRPQNLVKVDLKNSKLERLWEGVHPLTGLKYMDLQNSENLKEIPDFSKAKNLETLNLYHCSSLTELPASIKNLNKLTDLCMTLCENLETLPAGINLQSLGYLLLKGCSRLRVFPDISTNVKVLELDGTGIEEIPLNIHRKSLASLSMIRMKSGKLWKRVQPLASLITWLTPSLKWLHLSHIPSLVEVPLSFFENLNQLTQLSIIECINLEILPTGINLQSLYALHLTGCTRLKSFPDISTNISCLNLSKTGIVEVPWWIEKFSRLTSLDMDGCKNLQRVSLNLSKLKLLEKVDFSDCEALVETNWNDIFPTDKLPVPDEASSSLPQKSVRNVYLTFINCLNLDHEALFQRQLVFKQLRFSGEQVPSYFTHHTTETSLTNIPLLHTSLSQGFLRFKACVLFEFQPFPIGDIISFDIQLSFRFKGKHGNHLDYSDSPLKFWSTKWCNQMVVFESCISPVKDNAQLNYDDVDVQIHTSRLVSSSTFKLKAWGIRLFNLSSSPENPLSNPNTLPRVCKADEDIMVYGTEGRGECASSDTETERITKRMRTT